MKHRLWLEGLPANENGAPRIAAGWYGGPPFSTNEFVYRRVPNEADALELDATTAVALCRQAWNKGYPARCEPPITVTY